MLGGSWVAISRVISRVPIVLTHITGLITPLITTREPPSYSPTGRCSIWGAVSGTVKAVT